MMVRPILLQPLYSRSLYLFPLGNYRFVSSEARLANPITLSRLLILVSTSLYTVRAWKRKF